MIELNLLPDVKKEFIRAQRARNKIITIAFFAMIATGGLVFAFGFYVFAVQPVHTFVLDEQIKKKNAELKKVKELEKYLTIQNQLEQIGKLHDSKNTYSRLMDYLVKLNPGDPNTVAFTSVDVTNEETAITLKGITPTFESFNVFKDTLENAELTYYETDEKDRKPEDLQVEKLFENIQIESSNLSREQGFLVVSFTIRTEYNQKAFDPKLYDVSARVPDIETTPSVKQAPRPVFDGKIQEDN
jgi:Tfp pilus assembly protein PilN